MIYGLAGSSGSGKSTLGRSVAQALDLTFVETSITNMSRRAGFDPVAPMTLTDRCDLQESLLHQFQELLRSLQGPAILDRTPLDLIMYLMAEIDMASNTRITQERSEWARDYVARCTELTDRYFDHVFVTAPLPTYEEAVTRPGANPAYQMHTHLLMMGTLYDMTGNLCFSILRTSDMSERVDYVSDVIANRLDEIESARRSSLHIH